jgi:uncharacterized membrane protein YeaQ/YmgE (transglycosylase-associated protein family)
LLNLSDPMVPIHVQGCNVLTQTLQLRGTKGESSCRTLSGLRRGHHRGFLSSGPNRPNGFILTTGLGIAGAFVATFIGQTIGWYRLDQGAGATVSAVLVLFIWNRLAARRLMSDPGNPPPALARRRAAGSRDLQARAREVRPDGLASVLSRHR